MATYAAFKHVELYNVGNAKKRVLKPPGGGSSDIFGADQQTPRSMNKNRMQSNIFAEGQKNGVFRQGAHRYYYFAETPRRNGPGQDSHNRLFGELERPYTPAKNHMKSNLPIGDTTDAAANGKANGHGKATNGHHQNGNGTSSAPKTNGHHQNGNGVSEKTNGHSHSNGHSNGHHSNGHSNGSSASSAPSQNGSSHIFLRRLTSATSPKSSSMSSFQTSSSSASQTSAETPRSPRFAQRNPVTGNGVEDYADKPRKPSTRRGGENGNPVTGEGYKSGGAAEINTTIPSLNGAGAVINKNRIPPGGFSSGLW
ncbi:microtubule-associated protein Jupiter isoform X3 [Uranotaenia lowii]|uniref:microtubule-associated protein Jupiter isoform X2 n=1 Tax=Uranotaenia lowii TaxID=190385 RepID=UPI00247B1205|nr:microtubule-associated protein Jupiter isoform X2 [Uranotaenia lowii]XP_055602073.1 microtubule-associated protein Jupiter isoform X3 [Uranotaenia lowii]